MVNESVFEMVTFEQIPNPQEKRPFKDLGQSFQTMGILSEGRGNRKKLIQFPKEAVFRERQTGQTEGLEDSE